MVGVVGRCHEIREISTVNISRVCIARNSSEVRLAGMVGISGCFLRERRRSCSMGWRLVVS